MPLTHTTAHLGILPKWRTALLGLRGIFLQSAWAKKLQETADVESLEPKWWALMRAYLSQTACLISVSKEFVTREYWPQFTMDFAEATYGSKEFVFCPYFDPLLDLVEQERARSFATDKFVEIFGESSPKGMTEIISMRVIYSMELLCGMIVAGLFGDDDLAARYERAHAEFMKENWHGDL